MRIRTQIGQAVAVLMGCAALLASAACSSTEPAGMQADDGAVTAKVKAKLYADLLLRAPRVHVDTSEHVVYLFGTVPTDAVRARAERIARDTDGAWSVVDELTVGGKTVGQSIDDSVIQAKIKAAYIGDPLVKAFNVEVYSSKGVVTLVGRVSTEASKRRAEELARETRGVKSVVDRLEVGALTSSR